MNLGALLILVKLFQEIGIPSPGVEGQEYEIKPNCGVGTYAYKDPLSGKYSCVKIPKGR